MSTSFPPLHKRAGNWQLATYETAVVNFNGRLLAITFNRGWTATHGDSFTVRDWQTGEALATQPWTGGLGSAIVVNGVIHIFGSTDWGTNGNEIIHSVLDANFVPSAPTVVLQTNSSYRVYNTDLCRDGAQYVMTFETTSGIYFQTSPDLATWTGIQNGSIHQGQYCACPSIDYVNGWYLLTFLSHINGQYVTQVSRSQDLIHWQDFAGNAKYPPYICLIAPDGPGEGINTSDVSMAECNGTVYGVYMVGDQATWANQRTFTYFGTMSQLMGEFYP